MAHVYVDLDLATGLDDGTSWANAFKTAATGFTSSNLGGDTVWVKGTQSLGSNIVLDFGGGTVLNPVIVRGVLLATTNEPPVKADLIPGWRTGLSQIEANRAYLHADCPVLEVTGASPDLLYTGFVNMYAVNLKTGDNFGNSGSPDSRLLLEECDFNLTTGNGQFGWKFTNSSGIWFVRLLNCRFTAGVISTTMLSKSANMELIGLTMNAPAAMTGIFLPEQGRVDHIGCDYSDFAHTLFEVEKDIGSGSVLRNCQLHSSVVIRSGTLVGTYRIELHQCSFGLTGKTSGFILELDIITSEGDIVQETTAVRTGGASDGVTPWSMAFTPNVDATIENQLALVGPWMYFNATSGTNKTVTVHIANSGAADYNDDDVWLEVFTPSADGTSKFDHTATQMDDLDTPAVVADDTGSTWGTGGSNHQKLVATVSPDYDGIAYCRVHFAKGFSSSPETLYVDPQPVYA